MHANIVDMYRNHEIPIARPELKEVRLRQIASEREKDPVVICSKLWNRRDQLVRKAVVWVRVFIACTPMTITVISGCAYRDKLCRRLLIVFAVFLLAIMLGSIGSFLTYK